MKLSVFVLVAVMLVLLCCAMQTEARRRCRSCVPFCGSNERMISTCFSGGVVCCPR
uniref:Defensin n=1 Tax=Pyrocoelia rufa TaxID=71223 RepID=Q95UJ8_PYRRU|nr:defensin [Pyrocoelia rufa]